MDEEEAKSAPRFRNKPIEVSLFENDEKLDSHSPCFEGQTSSVSKAGVGVRVNPIGKYKRVKHEELEGETFIIKFHTAARKVPTVEGEVQMVGESHDMRYRVYLGFIFDGEFPLFNILT